jgi:hypothetical protein
MESTRQLTSGVRETSKRVLAIQELVVAGRKLRLSM